MKNVIFNGINYNKTIENLEKGINCKKCAFNRKSKLSIVCNRYGNSCKINTNGIMPIYIKSENQDIASIDSKGQISLF